MHAAFYIGTRPGLVGVYSRLIRAYEGGPASHCEAVFSNGDSASSSFMDRGVRFCGDGHRYPKINFASGNWVLYPIPDRYEVYSRAWFTEHEGESYDIRGNVRFLWPWGNRDSKLKSFCSESLMASLGFVEAYRYGVNTAASAVQILT